MSIHLLECAANLPLQPSTKLALMAFADSADRHTHIALPGLDQVQTWASVGRSRANELVTELTDLGLLRKHRPGRRGHRAEYVVFPEGCCREHPRPPAEEGSDQPDATSSTGSTHPDPDPHTTLGSGTPDSVSGNGSSTPDPNETNDLGSGTADPSRVKGPERVRHSGPLPQLKDLTPQPPASGGPATTSCPKPGPTPHVNCRRCGTTPRQIETRERREAAARARAAEQARAAEERARRAADRVPADAVKDTLAATRLQLASARSSR